MLKFGIGATGSTKKSTKSAPKRKASSSAPVNEYLRLNPFANLTSSANPVKRRKSTPKAAPVVVVAAPAKKGRTKAAKAVVVDLSASLEKARKSGRKTASAPVVVVAPAAAPAKKKGGKKKGGRPRINDGLTSSQRARMKDGTWKSFDTPLKSKCSAAGETWKTGETKAKRAKGAAQLAKCNWLKPITRKGKKITTPAKYF
jgi:hypothetical protein